MRNSPDFLRTTAAVLFLTGAIPGAANAAENIRPKDPLYTCKQNVATTQTQAAESVRSTVKGALSIANTPGGKRSEIVQLVPIQTQRNTVQQCDKDHPTDDEAFAGCIAEDLTAHVTGAPSLPAPYVPELEEPQRLDACLVQLHTLEQQAAIVEAQAQRVRVVLRQQNSPR